MLTVSKPHKDQKGQQAVLVSLGSNITLDFYYHPDNRYTIYIGETDYGMDPTFSVLLQPGSAFEFHGESFKSLFCD